MLTSAKKWSKLREILKKWWAQLETWTGENQLSLSHKELLADRGFLVYVTRTYPAMVPYLKGFHLTIEMWRGGRDAEGWKLPKLGVEETEEESEDDDAAQACLDMELDRVATGIHAPKDRLTVAIPRLKDEVEALI
jgi:hypothetical protein